VIALGDIYGIIFFQGWQLLLLPAFHCHTLLHTYAQKGRPRPQKELKRGNNHQNIVFQVTPLARHSLDRKVGPEHCTLLAFWAFFWHLLHLEVLGGFSRDAGADAQDSAHSLFPLALWRWIVLLGLWAGYVGWLLYARWWISFHTALEVPAPTRFSWALHRHREGCRTAFEIRRSIGTGLLSKASCLGTLVRQELGSF
jgi:hypothetical protein